MAKTIAIVGNGPSRRLFDTFDGDICLCNIPQLDIDYTYVSIVDRIAFNHIKEKEYKIRDILTTQELHNAVSKWGLDTKPAFKLKLMNSAATAAYYFAQDYDVIHLYGCDALWSEVTTSHQDEIIKRPPRNPNLHKQWRKHWQTVWETDKTFVIHHPIGEQPIDYRQNVCWVGE